MLDFELITRDGTVSVFAFYPEGDRARACRLSFDTKDNSFELLEDSGHATDAWCARHLARSLERMNSNGKEAESGTVIWY